MTLMPYKNEPTSDFSNPSVKESMQSALQDVQAQFGQTYPLYVGGKEVLMEKTLPSVNPAKKAEVVGYVSQANQKVIDEAISAAKEAFDTWRFTTPVERAGYLLKAAAIMRRRKFELCAWQIFESAKNWAEAEGDVNEAIDFLEFYARQAIALGNYQPTVPYPGEQNLFEYLPLGVGVVISPWNFPLAILTGMASSAIVTGNTILLKPAPTSSVMATKFVDIMREVCLPAGVLNFVPGLPEDIGDYMTGHKDVSFVSFTGSKNTGLHIAENAHRRIEGQRYVKRVIAEMGGKDGIIVDETADLELAAKGIVASAFGFQGQKCSAGSRAMIHESVYDELLDLVVRKASELKVGIPAENFAMGPVIDDRAFEKITGYIEIGKNEGRLLLGGTADDSVGYFVNPTIFADLSPDARVMKEEIFGPVLSICKVKTFAEAVDVFNNTEYGLTGSVYSNDRKHLEYARQRVMCGNLYFNRKCTGSLVGVHPFGGFNMSGTDAKAGGPDYLKNFVQPKVVTEEF
jgi:1-pyrroline-5-carboxylate dehydrogenase